MPYRQNALVGGEIYHVFNRSVAKHEIFHNARDYGRMLDLINFYRFFTDNFSYSKYNKYPINHKTLVIQSFEELNKEIVEIYAYSLMPNHFHFLLKAINDTSISLFMRQIQHAYSKYYNIKYDRTGSLIQGMFKAKRVETDEEFLHVSRYIHLNPVTAYLINIQDLDSYPWTSFKDYIQNPRESKMVNTKRIIDSFGSIEKYKEFIYDQVGYQRELASIKHLIQE